MIDVLLTHSNHIFNDRKQVRKMQPYPPLQTLLLAACLRRQGYSVALFDPTLETPEAGFEKALAEHRPRLVAICEDNFNFLTKMCLLRNRELAWWMAKTAAAAGVPVIANGADSCDRAGEYLHAGVDCVMKGEVEECVLEVCKLLLDGVGAFADIRGIAYLDAATEQVRQTAPRAPIRDLSALPMPAWDLVDAEPYRRAWLGAHGYFSLNMVSSRGCPYQCNWCAKPIWGDNYRCRAAHLVAQEMLEVKTRFRPDHLWFADDIFALSGQWTHEFTGAVKALGAEIPFKMQSRCDLMTRGTVEALRRAGCAEVWMGAESGSQRILDAMDKGIRVSEVGEACENLRRNGIRSGLFLQFGYPGEEWDDIEATLRMVRSVAPDDVGVSVSYPLPGTRFHQIVGAQMGCKSSWNDSADLAMMFHGTYSTEFYRALADAVHAEVRGVAGLTEAWQRVHELREAGRLVGVGRLVGAA